MLLDIDKPDEVLEFDQEKYEKNIAENDYSDKITDGVGGNKNED